MSKSKDIELEKLKFSIDCSLDHGIDLENRIIRITGVIGEPGGILDGGGDYFDFNLLDVALTKLENLDSKKPITIRINSGGGCMYDALAIVGRMKASPCTIITEAFGHAMSAATLILMAGDERKISRYCVSMFHEIGYGVSGQHEDIKEQVQQSEKELKRWAGYYEEFSKKSSRFWLTKMKKKEFYPTPEEMLDYGAVDELI